IEDIEQNIVNRVLEFGDRRVNSLFTHRSDIVYFNVSDSYEAIRTKINDEKHSAYPVSSSDSIDDIIGIVLIKDLFTSDIKGEFHLKNYVVTPMYFNESTSAYKVMEVFKQEKIHYGIVVD